MAIQACVSISESGHLAPMVQRAGRRGPILINVVGVAIQSSLKLGDLGGDGWLGQSSMYEDLHMASEKIQQVATTQDKNLHLGARPIMAQLGTELEDLDPISDYLVPIWTT